MLPVNKLTYDAQRPGPKEQACKYLFVQIHSKARCGYQCYQRKKSKCAACLRIINIRAHGLVLHIMGMLDISLSHADNPVGGARTYLFVFAQVPRMGDWPRKALFGNEAHNLSDDLGLLPGLHKVANTLGDFLR